ncbi:hypothetical protein VTK26DRAFT_7329 [Humicola hyalothermophila]
MTTTLPPDPWKALGIDRDADKAEIRSAYKKLVLKCHPDKVQDPTLKAQKQNEFQKVQQAYELLNDDAEKAKYEQKLKLAELQRAAAAKVQQEMKNSPNSSVPRSSPKYTTYDIRTAEPASRHKSPTSPSGGKVYTHYASAHTRSHEEVPSSRAYYFEEVDRHARRTASYEKPSKRDEERREKDERRRRRDEEDLLKREKDRERERDREKERDREREREREKEREREREKADREREKEREARKAEKKRIEKEREKERRREREDRSRQPYVEQYEFYVADAYAEDEKYVTSRSEKKRSSSKKKHDDTRDRERDRGREREKSSSRRAKSPHVTGDKHMDSFAFAQSYLSSQGVEHAEKHQYWKSQSYEAPSFLTPPAPSPPPVDFEEESIRHASARAAAGRRPSHDAARSKEKLRYEVVDATPARPIPPLSKSYSAPPPAPESPPRPIRSHTTPHETYTRTMPSLARATTWTASPVMDDRHPTAAEYYDDYSDDDRDRTERRRYRSSRRARSPIVASEPIRYKVDGVKTSKLDPQYVPYSGGESPSSRRYAPEEFLGAHSPSSTTYAGAPFTKVKESRSYGLGDVKYTEYTPPTYFSTSHHSHSGYGSGGDGYPVPA